MKIIDNNDKNIGKYYIIYCKRSGVFKSLLIFKYESFFDNIAERVCSTYDFRVTLTVDNTAPLMDCEERITFEIDGDEEFNHVTMPMVIETL